MKLKCNQEQEKALFLITFFYLGDKRMTVKNNIKLMVMGIIFCLLAGIVQCAILLSLFGLEFSDIGSTLLIMMWGVLSAVTGLGVLFSCS